MFIKAGFRSSERVRTAVCCCHGNLTQFVWDVWEELGGTRHNSKAVRGLGLGSPRGSGREMKNGQRRLSFCSQACWTPDGCLYEPLLKKAFSCRRRERSSETSRVSSRVQDVHKGHSRAWHHSDLNRRFHINNIQRFTLCQSSKSQKKNVQWSFHTFLCRSSIEHEINPVW